MADPLIIIERLSKVYHRDAIAIPVLQDINLAIGAGEYIALIGPSGSGKTTLLNLIAGIDSATPGRIGGGGRDLTTLGESDLARWRAEKVGFIFQLYNLVPVLTAWKASSCRSS